MKAEDIHWEEISQCDYKATVFHNSSWIMLRIESLDINKWWCSIYRSDNQDSWDNSGDYQPTLEKTKQQVVKALNEMIDA